VTDIRQARQAQILPLPSRAIGADGEVIVTVYQAGAAPAIDPYKADPGSSHKPERTVVPPRVARWKNSLLDLSLRNRLINYTERSGYRLEVPGPALARFEDAMNAGAPIALLPADAVPKIDDARGVRYGRDLPERTRELLLADKRSAYINITAAAYKGKLRYLAYKAKTIADETGANNLYLAFGMLSWRFNDRDLRSPLVLVPVQMSTASRGESYRLTIDEAGASTPNYCLLEKLRVNFGLEIPGLAKPAEDASGIDLPTAFDALRTAIAAAGLPFRVGDAGEVWEDPGGVHRFASAPAMAGDHRGQRRRRGMQPVQLPRHAEPGLVEVRDVGTGDLCFHCRAEPVKVTCGAGGGRRDGAVRDRGAQQLADRFRGAVLGQVLAHVQVHHDGSDPRPVLHGCTHRVRGVGRGGDPAHAPPRKELVLGDADLDRRQVEHLPAGHPDLAGVGKASPAPPAAHWVVADHLVRVGHL